MYIKSFLGKISLKKYCFKAGGFTLIEMMVSVGIFMIVVTLGINSIVNLTGGSKRIRAQRQAVDTFAFVMDSIARDLRTGARFECNSSGDCYQSGTNRLQFIDQAGDTTLIFLNQSTGTVEKSINGNTFTLTDPSVVTVNSFNFFVRDASDGAPNQFIQPIVVMAISGSVRYQNETIPIAVQTAVTQRTLDIPDLYGV